MRKIISDTDGVRDIHGKCLDFLKTMRFSPSMEAKRLHTGQTLDALLFLVKGKYDKLLEVFPKNEKPNSAEFGGLIGIFVAMRSRFFSLTERERHLMWVSLLLHDSGYCLIDENCLDHSLKSVEYIGAGETPSLLKQEFDLKDDEIEKIKFLVRNHSYIGLLASNSFPSDLDNEPNTFKSLEMLTVHEFCDRFGRDAGKGGDTASILKKELVNAVKHTDSLRNNENYLRFRLTNLFTPPQYLEGKRINKKLIIQRISGLPPKLKSRLVKPPPGAFVVNGFPLFKDTYLQSPMDSRVDNFFVLLQYIYEIAVDAGLKDDQTLEVDSPGFLSIKQSEKDRLIQQKILLRLGSKEDLASVVSIEKNETSLIMRFRLR